jgi:hypothetical protein
MRLYALIIFSLGLKQGLSQPNLEWQKSFGGSSTDAVISLSKSADGGYYLGNLSSSSNGDISNPHGIEDYWIVKTDANGNLQWEKSYGGNSGDWLREIYSTDDGGAILSGYSSSTNGNVTSNSGGEDYWIVKINSTGDIIWEFSFGGSLEDRCLSIDKTSDNGFILGGYSNSINGDVTGNNGLSDFWVVKINSEGVLDWAKSYGGTGQDRANKIQTTNDGGFIVVGYSSSSDGDISVNNGISDFWIIKLDVNGNLQWEKSYGGTQSEAARSVEQTSDGGYIVCGETSSLDGNVSINHGIEDAWIIKLSATGDLEWEKTIGGGDYDIANFIEPTEDGHYIIGGATFSVDQDMTGNNGAGDGWLVKLNSSGSIVWLTFFGGSSYDDINSVVTTTDGGLLLGGTNFSTDGDATTHSGMGDCWIVKLSNVQSTTEMETEMTNKLLKVTDLSGREVPILKNQVLLFVYENGEIERIYLSE